jgi:hypothetical protein
MPRLVRLGRAANDNLRPAARLGVRLLVVAVATSLALLFLRALGLI